MPDDNLSLSNAISDLRAELIASQEAGKDAAIKFDFTEIELELNVTAERSAKAGASVGWKLLGAEADGEKRSGSSHVLRLKMRLAGEDGKPLQPISGSGARPARGS